MNNTYKNKNFKCKINEILLNIKISESFIIWRRIEKFYEVIFNYSYIKVSLLFCFVIYSTKIIEKKMYTNEKLYLNKISNKIKLLLCKC